MAAELKEMFNLKFYQLLATQINTVHPQFNEKQFLAEVTKGIENRSLNQRLRHTTQVLKGHLPPEFKEAIKILNDVIPNMPTGYTTLIFPDYVGQFGLNDFEIAMKALSYYTQFGSSEFAIREFLNNDFDKTIAKMQQWSQSLNHHVRRLASEGCRPRLPWATALPKLKKNPESILPILHQLKTDPSEYVRRSVANNLNDIAKDNPEICLAIAKNWKGISKETDGIIKHGCRTLLKQGNQAVLKLFGLDASQISVSDFRIHNPIVAIGNYLEFSFSVYNHSNEAITVRLEYAIYYLRQNQQLSKKVFKITEPTVAPNQIMTIVRKQSFKIITTRKFFPGTQKLSIQINGEEKMTCTFELLTEEKPLSN